MRKQNKRAEVAQVYDDQFGYLGDAKNEAYLHPQPKVLNIFPVEGDPEFLVREALKRDLSKVEKIRFDPVNVCNIACIFCTSDLKEKHAQISPGSLQSILKRISQTCHRISCGCGFEPLMAKNIEEYIQTIKKVVNDEFAIKPQVNMVTNGLLLGNRELDSFEFLDWVHISVHSHRKENFEKIEKGANFDTLVSNIKNTRKKYTDLNIHIEFVVNQENKEDVEEFIQWAFEELQADSINLKRVAVESFHPRSYLAESKIEEISLGLSDEEWLAISKKTSESWPNKLAHGPAFSSQDQQLTKCAMTDFIEI
jgi:molybdenum cofactor biosynthesis enzyme MoaA